MIHVIPLQIQKGTSAEKEDYLKARCAKFEKALKASAPDRDASQDEEKRQQYLRHMLMLADGRINNFALMAVDGSNELANARLLKEKVNDIFALVDGETLIEEQTGQSENAIYVKQTTNLSTIFFTDDSLTPAQSVIEAEVSAVTEEGPASDETEQAKALSKVTKSVVDICKGLVKVVPPPYGTAISGILEAFSSFLSATSSSQNEKDTEKTIQRIGELVGRITWENNVKQTVNEQAGVIYGIIEGLNDHYVPLKKESKADYTHKELVDNYLTPYMLKLDTAINTLSQSDFSAASLPEYCLAAGAYFCVLQELATLDPDHPDDPFKSVWCKEIMEVKAPRFITYVNDTYEKIVKKAKDSVEPGTELAYNWRYGRKTYINETRIDWDTWGAWFYDNNTLDSHPLGYEYDPCKPSWAWDRCSEAREKWISEKQTELASQIESEMGCLKKLANEQWMQLKTKPLYGSEKKE